MSDSRSKGRPGGRAGRKKRAPGKVLRWPRPQPEATAFRIDLHVHSGRYSQCAECVDPFALGEWARKAGLAGLVLTEHDVLWEDEELGYLRASSPEIRFYRGIECTLREGHAVVIGIEDAGMLHRGASLELVTEYAHANGAAVILAHPFRDADPSRLPVQLVDGIEVGSTSFNWEEAVGAWDLVNRFQKPPVASSDAHTLTRVGWAWTEFPLLPQSERDLARLIREGAGRPVVPTGLEIPERNPVTPPDAQRPEELPAAPKRVIR